MNFVNKYVKVLLTNNIIMEGLVKEWGDESINLLSLNGNHNSIIFNPAQNIIAVKIIHSKPENINSEDEDFSELQTSSLEENNQSLEEKFEQTYNEPSENNDLRLKKLSDLRVELAKQDKKIISEKLKDHNVGGVKMVQYGSPNIFLKKKA